jgi:hypothetical protein
MRWWANPTQGSAIYVVLDFPEVSPLCPKAKIVQANRLHFQTLDYGFVLTIDCADLVCLVGFQGS